MCKFSTKRIYTPAGKCAGPDKIGGRSRRECRNPRIDTKGPRLLLFLDSGFWQSAQGINFIWIYVLFPDHKIAERVKAILLRISEKVTLSF